jgi:hypothetical protein
MNEAQRRDQFLSLVRNRMDPALRGADYDRCFNSVRAERPDLLDNRSAPTLAIANSFDPSQPRDEQGQWTSNYAEITGGHPSSFGPTAREKIVSSSIDGPATLEYVLKTDQHAGGTAVDFARGIGVKTDDLGPLIGKQGNKTEAQTEFTKRLRAKVLEKIKDGSIEEELTGHWHPDRVNQDSPIFRQVRKGRAV